jgi:hypothetical protein
MAQRTAIWCPLLESGSASAPGFSVTTLQPIDGPILFALNDSTSFDTAVQASVPEPGTFILLLSVAAALGVRYRSAAARARSSPSRDSVSVS